MLVGMGTPVQTLPISAAALREVDIIGTFRYANTYLEAIELVNGLRNGMPDLSVLITHRFSGLESVEEAFEMASKSQDNNGEPILKVLISVGEDALVQTQ